MRSEEYRILRDGRAGEVEPGVWEWRARWKWEQLLPLGVLAAAGPAFLAVALLLWDDVADDPQFGLVYVVAGLGACAIGFWLLVPSRLRLDDRGVTVRGVIWRRRAEGPRIRGVWFESPARIGLPLTIHGTWRNRVFRVPPCVDTMGLASAAMTRYGMHPRLQEHMRRAVNQPVRHFRGRVSRLGHVTRSVAWILAAGAVAAMFRDTIWVWILNSSPGFGLGLMIVSGAVVALGILRAVMLIDPRGPVGLDIQAEGLRIHMVRGEEFIGREDIIGVSRRRAGGQVALWTRRGDRVERTALSGGNLRCERYELAAVLMARYGEVWPGGWCPACGYELRGLGDGRCPECGAASRERDGNTEQGRGGWLWLVRGYHHWRERQAGGDNDRVFCSS